MYDVNDKASAVREIQRFLVELHYNLKEIPLVRIDGIYGEATRRAVNAFQGLSGLPETGVVDYPTFTALYRTYRRYYDERTAKGFIPPDRPLPVSLGDSGEGILNLQKMMNSLAERYRIPIRTDGSGVFSYATGRLASAIARIYRMEENGSVSRQLYAKMLRDYGYPQKEGE